MMFLLRRHRRGSPTIGVGLAAVGLLLLSGLCGCQTPARPENPESGFSQAAVVPGAGGGSEDRIDALDLAVGPGETLHLAWREVDYPEGGGQPGYRTLYARGDEGGATWSSPEVLRPAAGSPPRVFRGRSGIHVLAGRELHHLFRGDSGSWQALGRIVPEGSLVAEGRIPGFAYFGVALDAAADGEDLAVVYLVRRGSDGPLGLDLVRWRPDGAAAPRRLAGFPGAGPQQPAPRMLALGERWHILWAVNEVVRETSGPGPKTVERYSSRARLFYLRSHDREAGWTEPMELTSGLSTLPQEIDDVELLATGEGLVALYNARGLYLSQSVNGEAWSLPSRIAAFRERSGSTGTGSWSLTAAGGAIAWIDERFQSTDRRWWNPLGGWPWSDAPEGIDNDVFLLPPSGVESARAGRPAEPLLRQTPEPSFAFRVSLRASRHNFYLFWSGLGLPHEETDDHPPRPQIFYRVLPLEPSSTAQRP